MKLFLIISVFAFITLQAVIGNPRDVAVQDTELSGVREKRQLADLIEGGINSFIKLIREAVDNAGQCAEKAGCHKGYCWTYCGLSLRSGDWCYTTRSYSQSFQYIKCTDDSECDKCWKCAGSCTL